MIKILGKLYERNPIQVTEQQASKDSYPWEMGRKVGETCMQLPTIIAWGKFPSKAS